MSKATLLKIKIIKTNESKIEAALATVNGKATAHTFTTYDDIMTCVVNGEQLLKTIGLVKTNYVGAEIRFTSGNSISKTYKYSRIVTSVLITRKQNGWFLTIAVSHPVFGKCSAYCISLSKDQDDQAVAALRKNYRVRN